jgi:hypothetical protein
LNITGLPGHPIEGIMLSDIHITYSGGGTASEAARRDIPEMESYYPEYHMFGTLPAYGLYVRHASGIILRNVTFDHERPDLRSAMVFDDVEGIELDGVRAEGGADNAALVRFNNVRDAYIHGCRPLNKIGTFLRVEGTGSSGILLQNNDLRKVTLPIKFANGAVGEN